MINMKSKPNILGKPLLGGDIDKPQIKNDVFMKNKSYEKIHKPKW